MRLEAKLALFNTLSKLLLVLLGALLIPPIVERVAVSHTDEQLREKCEQVLTLIRRDGITTFVQGEQYADYNILKQEYITLTPLPAAASSALPARLRIFDEPRQVDSKVEDFRIISRQFVSAGRRYRLEIGSSLATVELLTATLRRMALWVLVIGAFVTVLSDAAFAHHLLRPLHQLIVRRLEGVHHPSAFSYEPLATTTADFQRLDSSLTDMMRLVQSAFEKEREFMSNVSHELLTPVSILQTRFENMLQDPTLDEAHLLKIVDSQKTLYRLRNTVKTLLLIANIENEQYLRDESVSVAAVLADVAEELEDRLTQREIVLRQDLQPDYVLPQANPTLLFTLIFNLVSNAIKYNCEGGRILITGRPASGGGYQLAITDTGPGIAARHLPYLFDRFRRVQAGAAAPEGYGLGLPIAKTITEFHQARLTVESTEGQGTTFTLHFS
ncbi:hypothetical protein D0N36_10995 [Hymenobacter lapidiphilus]|uniref:sensor histidine kinase n=1 Tax=Hymenobacter sp. CCM 8763 TaxID=2303334 RepID=UPI000E353B0A|nr:HAMP domain-containing sensor histidine kinase [Hymenobacter sp. CCM 8763]RFP65023.1 hypothetical protein D0N36_10995 [Hymenobacter sp. CCM 8763]